MTALEEGKLPSTDSRLRPDQLALERGDVDGAEREKLRVEEKQRGVRKQREEKGEGQVEPKWFEKEGDGWRFGGGYCKFRVGWAKVECAVALTMVGLCLRRGGAGEAGLAGGRHLLDTSVHDVASQPSTTLVHGRLRFVGLILSRPYEPQSQPNPLSVPSCQPATKTL